MSLLLIVLAGNLILLGSMAYVIYLLYDLTAHYRAVAEAFNQQADQFKRSHEYVRRIHNMVINLGDDLAGWPRKALPQDPADSWNTDPVAAAVSATRMMPTVPAARGSDSAPIVRYRRGA
jgi:hypothetical protein